MAIQILTKLDEEEMAREIVYTEIDSGTESKGNYIVRKLVIAKKNISQSRKKKKILYQKQSMSSTLQQIMKTNDNQDGY